MLTNAAVSRFDDATVAFSDAEITLNLAQGTPADLFDELVGEIDAAPPKVFSPHAVLTPASPEGGDDN